MIYWFFYWFSSKHNQIIEVAIKGNIWIGEGKKEGELNLPPTKCKVLYKLF